MRGTTETQALLICRDVDGHLNPITPIYEKAPTYPENWPYVEGNPVESIDYLITNCSINSSAKILSAKGYKENNGSIKKAKNNLTMCYNYLEWKDSSGLKEEMFNAYVNIKYNQYTKQTLPIENGEKTLKGMIVYNAGDIPTDLQLTFNSIPQDQEMTIKLYSWENQDNILGSITLKPIKKIATGDTKLIFDSKLKMFKGADASGTPTGTSYNNYRKEGDFFKLPTEEVLCSENDFLVIEINLEIPFEVKYKHHYI
jgi:hypothetical protein